MARFWDLSVLRSKGRELSSRSAWIEGVAIYLLFVVLYSLFLNSVPGKLEHFEEWVAAHTSSFSSPRPHFSDYFRIISNDTNCAVNAPFYIGLTSLSVALFGPEVFAYRLPGVLLSALVPALSAAVARRFLARDIALWVGLVMGAHHTVLSFARTGGYLAPTLALYLLVFLFSLKIAFDNSKRAWMGLVLSILAAPFFYATIRYMLALPLAVVGLRFLTSREFRREHLMPIICSACVVGAALGHFFWWRGPLNGALVLFEGRGEQLLVTPETVKADRAATDPTVRTSRYERVFNEVLPKRIEELTKIYAGGGKLFNHRHTYIHDGLGQRAWRLLRYVLAPLYLVGVLSCLISARYSPRYLIPLVWVVLSAAPLLVTTGVSVNRLVLGLPGDALIVGAGISVLLALISAILPKGSERVVRGLILVSAAAFVAYAVTVYFNDYRLLPQI